MNILKALSNLFFIYPLVGLDHICQIHLSALQLLTGPLHICDIQLLAQGTKVPLPVQQTTNSDFNASGQPHQGHTSKSFCNLTKQQDQLVKNLQGPFLTLCLLKKCVFVFTKVLNRGIAVMCVCIYVHNCYLLYRCRQTTLLTAQGTAPAVGAAA